MRVGPVRRCPKVSDFAYCHLQPLPATFPILAAPPGNLLTMRIFLFVLLCVCLSANATRAQHHALDYLIDHWTRIQKQSRGDGLWPDLSQQAFERSAGHALGDRFDLRALHDPLLSQGAVPLTHLEEMANDRIRAEQHGETGREGSFYWSAGP